MMYKAGACGAFVQRHNWVHACWALLEQLMELAEFAFWCSRFETGSLPGTRYPGGAPYPGVLALDLDEGVTSLLALL